MRSQLVTAQLLTSALVLSGDNRPIPVAGRAFDRALKTFTDNQPDNPFGLTFADGQSSVVCLELDSILSTALAGVLVEYTDIMYRSIQALISPTMVNHFALLHGKVPDNLAKFGQAIYEAMDDAAK